MLYPSKAHSWAYLKKKQKRAIIKMITAAYILQKILLIINYDDKGLFRKN